MSDIAAMRVARRCYERPHLLQIFRMRAVVFVGFGLGIDACWAGNLSMIRLSRSQLCVTPSAPIWRSPDS
jgi:hypothetical protein